MKSAFPYAAAYHLAVAGRAGLYFLTENGPYQRLKFSVHYIKDFFTGGRELVVLSFLADLYGNVPERFHLLEHGVYLAWAGFLARLLLQAGNNVVAVHFPAVQFSQNKVFCSVRLSHNDTCFESYLYYR